MTDFTESDIMALAIDNDIATPTEIEITPAIVRLRFAGSATTDAIGIFNFGLDAGYWVFDNNTDTQEFTVTVDNGGVAGLHTVAIIQRR